MLYSERPQMLMVLYFIFAGSVLLFPGRAWQLAKMASVIAGFIAVSASVWRVHQGNFELLPTAVGLLAVFIGWIVLGFSERYLIDEANQHAYVAKVLLCLGLIETVVQTESLVWMFLAWGALLVTMNRLLLFYPDRPAARWVVIKKTCFDVLTGLCLFAVLTVMWLQTGKVNVTLADVAVGPHSAWAGFFLAIACVLTTAQLPFHGWLIQVMEAPTPVSALLHAGVVNLAGYILLRLHVLVEYSLAGRYVLVAVGGITAVCCAFVLMTRISIKVRLAWSTCAQMGFMLMECGLGLYSMAVLHLIGHSLYKAYAFLSSGDSVSDAIKNVFVVRYRRDQIRLNPYHAVFALIMSLFMVWIVQWIVGLFVTLHESWMVAVFLASGLWPLLWLPEGSDNALWRKAILQFVGIVLAYWVVSALMSEGLPPAVVSSSNFSWVLALFALLFVVQLIVWFQPNSNWVSRWYGWVYNGFYLDDFINQIIRKLPIVKELA
ncbi:MAG TPA: NADH-quinone oxidoreductase subunit L [Limnobacter sp.]|uniref:NADH-quinone oxidoreductase subunit L n=1 Tax=Limnobacter sp. TaxID=2003368 RepID=UPI002E2F26D9|nr:NADH-quinone oxidoreductase subunit L [Limnobacter sp.]HEX5485383.1 NADH-quinone oxidoreductase subunit L [Limnobacter sp.]